MKKGSKMTEEQRKRLSEAHKGQIAWNKDLNLSNEHIRKLKETGYLFKKGQRPWITGKHHSKESRKKMSEGHKGIIAGMAGKRHSEESRKKMSTSHKGKPSARKGKYHSEESKTRMSEAHKGKMNGEMNPFYGKTHSEETRRKISLARKGIPLSEETKRKISLSGKGRIISEETKRKIRESGVLFKKGQIPWTKGKPAWNKGKFTSEETKRKMSLALKGHNVPEEVKIKISMAHKGKHPSEETKRKMREVMRLRLSNPDARKKYSERSRTTLLKLYESRRFPRQENTKPERQIKEELIKRDYVEGVDFIHQYKFNNKFMCDFCFPNQKVIVEVYGDFWHANPNKYAGKTLHPHQIKGIGRDKSKEAYITTVDNHSWEYLVLWESDIKKDVSKCVDKIEQALKKSK